MMVFQTFGEAVIFAGGVAAAFVVLWKWPVGPLYRKLGAEYKESVREMIVEEVGPLIEAAVAPIKEELQANGGSTVKDVVLVTRDKVDDLQRQVEKVLTQ